MATETPEVEMLFVIPDISGYTNFMLAHQQAPEYAQSVIRQLMEAMLKEKAIPLKISSIEGDALFLYAAKESEEKWADEKETIAETIENFFVAFYAEAKRLMDEKQCGCNACADIEALRIKIIVHIGKAIIDQLDRFTTLNGVDVIIVHRLLKNSLIGEYLLVTRPAFEACRFPRPERFAPHQEVYKDVGTIEAFVYQSSK
jgi:hypothetical protein